EVEALGVVRGRALDHDHLAALAVRERAGDGLAGGDLDVGERVPVVTGGRGQVPAGRDRLVERVAVARNNVRERAGVRECRVRVVVEREAGRAEAAAGREVEALGV